MMTRMKRIDQRVCCPDDDAVTRVWNNGTLKVVKRITFNNENGIHVHKILENQQNLSSMLEGAGEKILQDMAKEMNLMKMRLYVSPTEEYKAKSPLDIEIEIEANNITRGELALRCAKLVKDYYDGIRNEFGPMAPSFSEYPDLGHPVPFERMLLASMDCMEEETKRTWQAVYALD